MPLTLLHRHVPRADRLSPIDMTNLRVEQHGRPAHIAALALLDGRPLRDEAGALRLEPIRRYVEQRTRPAVRLHQVLAWPHGSHRAPVWQDDPGFDIADHVHTRRVPAPGDEPSLLRLCSELNTPPLDRSRPLWEMWLLDGLAGDQVALLLRLHHVVADGTAALELFSSMFDPAAEPPGPDARDAGPRRPDGSGITRLVRESAMRAQQSWALVRGGPAPALSWNRPVGTRRMHVLVRGDLARAKEVAHRHGGKVNDVVLAAVAGGAYRLLEHRDELAPAVEMRVSVAVSIRRRGETGGNRTGIRVIAVPVSEPDPARRLATICARTAGQRDRPPLQPGGRFLQRLLVRTMTHQRVINLVLSNMPGPPATLSFAGAPMREMFQLSTLQGNCAVGVGVLSYVGQLNVDVAADPDVVPDAELFARGVAETLERLGALRDSG